MDSMASVLKEKFEDWQARLEIIRRRPLERMETPHNPIFIERAGVEVDEAKELVRLSIVRGAIPEPIRMAHLIASGMKLGESKGRA